MADVYGQLERIDYWVIGGYLLLSMFIGLWFARRGTQDPSAYFVAGSSMPWWLAGISLIATAFAADTPLWLGEAIYKRGLEGAWLHWAPGIGAAFYVLIIAPLWKRSGVMTDLEFLELRYSGRAAAALRFFNSIYGALFANILMLAVGTLSVTTIMQATTGMPKVYCVALTVGGALVYCAVSGLWGVAATDFMQFFVTFIGSSILAFFALRAAGGLDTMITAIRAEDAWVGSSLRILPGWGAAGGLPLLTIIFLFTVRWLDMTCIGAFFSQRLFATKSPRHASFTALLFVAVYWSLVPLPWIITILASKVVMPELALGQEAYPRMAMTLPAGLKGILISSMLAAFMSTYSTLLNWGSSYVINDLYRRFLVRHRSPRHYVVVAQVTMIPMALIGALIAFYASSVLNLLFYSMLATAGYGMVLVARWFWWRVNAWSEVAGLGSSLVATLLICGLVPRWIAPENMEQYLGHRMLSVVVFSLVIWVTVTLLTKPVDREVLDRFYRRIEPPGYWGPVRQRLGLRSNFTCKGIIYRWAVVLVVLFGPLLGSLKLLVGQTLVGVVLVAAGGVALFVAIKLARELPGAPVAETES